MGHFMAGIFRNVLLQSPSELIVTILEQEVNDLRFYLMHISPVPYASSLARWVLTAPSSHSATPLG